MSKFKTGDKVFCTSFGEGVISSDDNGKYFPLGIKFAETKQLYMSDGREHRKSKYPSLFHSPQESAEYFSKIKRKEKRVIKVWVNVYKDSVEPWETQANADWAASCDRITCVPIEQEVEYEV